MQLTQDNLFTPEHTFEETKELQEKLKERCSGKFVIEDEEPIFSDDVSVKIEFPAGREKKWVYCHDYEDYENILNIDFEKYSFINGLDAICNYSEGTIEASIQPINGISILSSYRGLFGVSPQEFRAAPSMYELEAASPENEPQTIIKISKTSKELVALLGISRFGVSLKIKKNGINQHDNAKSILTSISNSLFFQIDLLSEVPLTLNREKTLKSEKKPSKNRAKKINIAYPKIEYDEAPISLYWYARSAVKMPLLQFLAFYQVIEFYYPTYSQIDVRRRLKTILKDPTFRGEKDTDIGKILSAIQINRSGAFGDERSQLKATLAECIDAESLREYFKKDSDRVDFFSNKAKGLTDSKLSIKNNDSDLRNEVAERIYEIRCKIVHTKTDSRTGELELLLPFSKEAEMLSHDIDLVQHIAQRVLVAASSNIR